MLRQKDQLAALARRYPGCWKTVDMFRAERGQGSLPDWPEWCFLPLAAAYAIVSQGQTLAHGDYDSVVDIAKVGALSAWRVTQGIYRFDRDVYDEVWKTPFTREVPTEILLRLPEWCIYVETPNLVEHGVFGFYAHLEQDMNHGHIELRLLYDVEPLVEEDLLTGLFPGIIHLVPGGTLFDGLMEAARTAAENDPEMMQSLMSGIEAYERGELSFETLTHGFGRPLTPSDRRVEAATICLPQILSLLLFICSVSADFTPHKGSRQPMRPAAKKVKKGTRTFAPPEATVWTTGFRMGSALRRMRQEAAARSPGEGTGRSPAPHVRVAHWHSFWTGPKKDLAARNLIAKWLPPIPVGFSYDDLDSMLIPTVRRVK